MERPRPQENPDELGGPSYTKITPSGRVGTSRPTALQPLRAHGQMHDVVGLGHALDLQGGSLSHSIVEKLVRLWAEPDGEHADHGDFGNHGAGLEALKGFGSALAGRRSIRRCGTRRAPAAP